MLFNFDEWMNLFKNDPEEAERRRKEVIKAAIACLPPERQERFHRLQWRIDRERERYSSPLGSCLALNRMLMDRVYEPGGFVDSLNALCGRHGSGSGNPSPTTQQHKTAAVLDFPKK